MFRNVTCSRDKRRSSDTPTGKACLLSSFLFAGDSIKAHQNAYVCPHLHEAANATMHDSNSPALLLSDTRVTTLSGPSPSLPARHNSPRLQPPFPRAPIDVPSIPSSVDAVGTRIRILYPPSVIRPICVYARGSFFRRLSGYPSRRFHAGIPFLRSEVIHADP